MKRHSNPGLLSLLFSMLQFGAAVAACTWIVSTYGLQTPGAWLILAIGAFYGAALLACLANVISPGSGYARVSFAQSGPLLSPRALRRIRCAALLLPIPLIFFAGSVNHYLQKGPHCYRCYKRKCVAEAIEKFLFQKSVLFDNKNTDGDESGWSYAIRNLDLHFYPELKKKDLDLPIDLPKGAVLYFRVYRDGAIGRVRLVGDVQKSERRKLIRAIKKLTPFEPLPAEICKTSTYIEFMLSHKSDRDWVRYCCRPEHGRQTMIYGNGSLAGSDIR